MRVYCRYCGYCTTINKDNRLLMGQENKEILNLLERGGFDLDNFCYCEKNGFIESKLAWKECEAYQGIYP